MDGRGGTWLARLREAASSFLLAPTPAERSRRHVEPLTLPEGRLATCPYVVFDLETTGLAPSRGDRIVAIGAVRLKGGRVDEVDRFATFCHPGRPIPPALTPLVERYRQIYLGYEPKDARYLENHRGHLMFLRPEEHEVCTAELIRATTFTGTSPQIREQLGELRRAGFAHVGVTIRHGHPEMLEEWAEVFEGV